LRTKSAASLEKFFNIPRYFWVSLIVITAFAACIRLYRLAEYPQHFTADEMSSSYEAWSLWTTGADQHGNVLPLHVRRYNDYAPALPIYLSAPIVGLLGIDEFSSRLPYALMGIGAVFGTAILGRRWFGALAGLIAALFLAIDPWAVNFSRTAYTLGCVPLFTVLSLYTFTRFIEALNSTNHSHQRPTIWAATCALCFAMLTLSYEPMKLQGPLLVAICALAALSCLQRHYRFAIVWIGLYILFVSPLLIDHILHGSLLQQHFGEMSLIGKPGWVATFVEQYIDQYTPLALFVTGLNRSTEVDVSFGIGELFWLEGILWIAAVALARWLRYSVRCRLNLPILLALWFVTYPLASSLTINPTAHREINFLPLPELLAGLGAAVVLEWVARTRSQTPAALIGAVAPGVALLICFITLFLQSYFSVPWLTSTEYPDYMPYNIGLRPALDYLQAHADPCDEIWIEPVFASYMAYLFYTRYPPIRFQHANVFKKEDGAGWLWIPWLDGVWFAIPDESPYYQAPLIKACKGKSWRVWFVGKKTRLSTWPTVFSVNNASGASIWRLQVKERVILMAPSVAREPLRN
jgi:4-amino-4-deoxy-L-arabinose transferase-like glycosyltransferase